MVWFTSEKIGHPGQCLRGNEEKSCGETEMFACFRVL